MPLMEKALKPGRITKQAVLALKARTLLYQASPLFNIANDVNLWKQAAFS